MAELEALVLPIADGAPAGSNLRLTASDVTFQRIQESRSELLPEVDPTGAGRAADWATVARECEAALRAKTKDLELAVWLSEAWARTRGFSGLRDGLRLTSALCDAFWDSLHPGLDDGALDLALRARPLNWLGSSRNMLRSVAACALVPVEGKSVLTYEDYKLSQLVDEKAVLPDKRQHQELVARGLFGGDEWRARLTSAGAENLAALHAEVSECQAAVAALREQSAKRFGDGDAPSLIPLADLLGEIRARLDPHVAPAPAPLPEEPAQSAAAKPAAPQAAAPARGPIASRADALRALAEAAEYFRKQEPHSPIAALVARAVRWGSLPFEAVLREVVQDEAALSRVWNTLGITTEAGADAAKKPR
ncbi:MAG TPA: type VI secretion system protein TssA [Myxococcota bacterium]|nr:type VI secretion system protein TssA [Myxococcota bacterium]